MIRAFQWDLARQVERLDFLTKQLPRYARWGYEELYLHLEDSVHYPSLPGVGREDAYSYEELGELVLTAAQCGIRTVPIVNLLGHTQYLIKHPELRELNELRDARGEPLPNGQICPLHPRLLEVATKLLRDMAPYCTAGKVHVGLDESFHLGKCPRCRDEVGRLGLGGHFAGHVSRLHRITQGLGLKLGLWADMLYFVPEAIRQLPTGITAYDWYYYPFDRHPRVEFFNFAECDLQPALKKQGIGYYGCPMNGAFRHEPMPVFGDRLANIRSWWRRCQAVGADGMLITSWETYRLAVETAVTVDAAAASLWLNPDEDDATAMLARGLGRMSASANARPQARALLAADQHAFAGYARWQINERWDVSASEESVAPYLAEARLFERMVVGPLAWPPAFAASLAFRLYLARRDVFVRQAARDVFRWRRLFARGEVNVVSTEIGAALAAAKDFAVELRRGMQAARAMWNRSRHRERTGHNAASLAADHRRLKAWRSWLQVARKHPGLLNSSTPVCGPWQLNFRVHNFAPAMQKVVVERQEDDGAWSEVVARHTIEFRASAARPRSRIVREFSAPVPSPLTPLRVAVRGVGQIAISHVALTNGVATHRRIDWTKRLTLGAPAPTHGFPSLDKTAAILPLSFPEKKTGRTARSAP